MTNAVQLDSLIANEFAFEIGGERVNGIFRISNLQTYLTDEDGKRLKPPFEVSKMVQRDGNNVFNRWLRETTNARDSDKRVTRDVAVLAIDDGVETRRWIAKGAYIIAVSYTDFDSSSFEMIAENYRIGYDDIIEEWPATENLE